MADPIDTDRIRSTWGKYRNRLEPATSTLVTIDDQPSRRMFEEAAEDALALCAEVDRLRDLLRQALPWIDPNDRHEDYLLTVAIREALGEPT